MFALLTNDTCDQLENMCYWLSCRILGFDIAAASSSLQRKPSLQRHQGDQKRHL